MKSIILTSGPEFTIKNENGERKAKEIVSLAIQKCSTEQATEITVSVVPLPNDDMKARIIGREEDYDRLFKAVPNEHNGITFCTGSLGAGRFNDLPKMAGKYAKRIYFAHLRQLKYTSETDFYENGHQTSEGNVDIYEIVKALQEVGFEGYIRPDHGRMIWGETGRPGYGLYDRALGATYINGLFEACEKASQK